MKTKIKIILWYLFIFITGINNAFSASGTIDGNAGVLNWVVEVDWKSWLERIRKWDLHLEDFPNIIHSMINTFIWIAGTVSVVFVIIWAYKVLFGSFWWV